MTKEQFDKMYVGEKLVVHCDTEEKANEFLKLADSFGYKWCDGESYLTEKEYDSYGEDTCYYISHGFLCDLAFYKNIGYKVVKFEKEEESDLAFYKNIGYKVVKFEKEEEKGMEKLPVKVIFNKKKGRTVAIFKDGTKVISELSENDVFSEGLGFLYCYVKKHYKEKYEKFMPQIEQLAKKYNQTDNDQQQVIRTAFIHFVRTLLFNDGLSLIQFEKISGLNNKNYNRILNFSNKYFIEIEYHGYES